MVTLNAFTFNSATSAVDVTFSLDIMVTAQATVTYVPVAAVIAALNTSSAQQSLLAEGFELSAFTGFQTTTTAPATSDSDDDLSTAAIVGIALGCAAVLILVTALICAKAKM